jgi:integrase
MKGRPLSTAEIDRMMNAACVVRPDDGQVWARLVKGLWLSGLRIGEAMALSWDRGSAIWIDLHGGRHPHMVIHAEAEKGGRNRRLPITPEFVEFLRATPVDEQRGPAFPINGLWTGFPICSRTASRVLSEIGKMAGVVVSERTGKYASAHDLRRSFGTRLAQQVRPATSMQLMRHESIDTTMGYYVDIDADDVGDELWGRYDAATGVKARSSGDQLGGQAVVLSPVIFVASSMPAYCYEAEGTGYSRSPGCKLSPGRDFRRKSRNGPCLRSFG